MKFSGCLVVNFGGYCDWVVLTVYLFSISCFGFFFGGGKCIMFDSGKVQHESKYKNINNAHFVSNYFRSRTLAA